MKPPKWPKTVRSFEIPIYGVRLYVITSRDEAKQCDYYLHRTETWPIDGTSGFAIYEKNLLFFDPLFAIAVFNPLPSVIAHECAHIAFRLLGRVGVPVQEGKANEAFCYLLDWLVTQVTALVPTKLVRK